MLFRIFLVVALVSVALAFSPSGRASLSRVRQMKPLYENFGLDIAEDPSVNTPRQILGEANYVRFVQSYDDKALRVGGSRYDIIERIRTLKLLTATADSGLLEALEAKGLTLSKVEKLLPIIDKLDLLPLLVKNKDQMKGLAPLLIEPAPALLPVVAGLLSTSPSNFLLPGLTLLGVGAYEVTLGDNGFLGIFEVLLGLPLAALGGVLGSLGSFDNLPPVPRTPIKVQPSSSSSSSRPTVSARPQATARPQTTSTPAKVSSAPSIKIPFVANAGSSSGGSKNGQRKTIRVK